MHLDVRAFRYLLELAQKNPSKTEDVLICSVFLLSVFLMLFECRAKYLFLYSPFFVILAVVGWSSFAKLIKAKLSPSSH